MHKHVRVAVDCVFRLLLVVSALQKESNRRVRALVSTMCVGPTVNCFLHREIDVRSYVPETAASSLLAGVSCWRLLCTSTPPTAFSAAVRGGARWFSSRPWETNGPGFDSSSARDDLLHTGETCNVLRSSFTTNDTPTQSSPSSTPYQPPRRIP
jgi:hypothetical protein